MKQSRVLHLEKTLVWKGFKDSLRALDWMIEEMCAEKGFKRHNGGHYYHHLVAVAQDLLDFGVDDEDIITASILHDAIEDIDGVTYIMIKDKFNERVADMVQRVTKLKGINYRDPEQLLMYLKIILEDLGSSLIKTADGKHNFGTLREATPEKQLRKAIETEKYHIPFYKEARNKYPRYAGYFFSAKTTIEPHLWKIKDHFAEVEALHKQIVELQNQIKNIG